MSEDILFFPTAVYGKSGEGGKVPEGYRWLERSGGFPDPVFAWADKYAKSFQWVSKAGKSFYEPVTAWVPLGGREGGGLFFQILDAGDDDRGRPHTLRMKAAYVPPEAIEDNPDLLLFLLGSSQGADSGTPIAVPPAISPENNGPLEEFRKAWQQADLDPAHQAVLLTSEPDTFSLRPPHSIKVFNRTSRSLIQEIPAVQSMEASPPRTQETKISTYHENIQTRSSKMPMTKKIMNISLTINIVFLIFLIYGYIELESHKQTYKDLGQIKEDLNQINIALSSENGALSKIKKDLSTENDILKQINGTLSQMDDTLEKVKNKLENTNEDKMANDEKIYLKNPNEDPSVVINRVINTLSNCIDRLKPLVKSNSNKIGDDITK